MSAGKEHEGLEFSRLDLAEESAQERAAVSAEYRPVASVIKLDSFAIEFEPDEEVGGGERKPSQRRRTKTVVPPPAPEEREEEDVLAETQMPPEDDLLAAPESLTPAQSRREEGDAPLPDRDETGDERPGEDETSPVGAEPPADEEELIGLTVTEAGSGVSARRKRSAASSERGARGSSRTSARSSGRTSARRRAEAAEDLFLGIDDGADLPGMSGDMEGFPDGEAGDGALWDDEGADSVADESAAGTGLPPLFADTDAGFDDVMRAFTDDGSQGKVRGGAAQAEEDDILRSIPAGMGDFFAGGEDRLFADEEGGQGGERDLLGEEEADDAGGASRPGKRRAAEAERVPLKLRGRLTQETPDTRRRRGQETEPEDPLLEGLGAGGAAVASGGELSSLLQDFSAPSLWDDVPMEEEPQAKPARKTGKAKNAPAMAGMEFDEIPDDLPALGGGGEEGVEQLLAQARELTSGGARKKKAKSGDDFFPGLGLDDDAGGMDGWGDAGMDGGLDTGLDGMHLDLDDIGAENESAGLGLDGMSLDTPLDSTSDLPPAGRAFVRRVERCLRRMPHFHELTEATRQWLHLLHSFSGEVGKRGLSEGTRQWLSNVRSFAGLEQSVLKPWQWRQTRFADDPVEEDGVAAFGSGLPGMDDHPGGGGGLLGGIAEEGESEFSGWGGSESVFGGEAGAEGAKKSIPAGIQPHNDDWGAPTDTLADTSASDDAAGMEVSPDAEAGGSSADSDMPPEDILPDEDDMLGDEDLSFSTADMLMQDSELGLSTLEDEFDLSGDLEAETPDQIPVVQATGWRAVVQPLAQALRKWALLCYRALDHYVNFKANWWKMVDFIALIILTMAAATFFSYLLWYRP